MATFSDIRLMGVSGGSSELNSSTSTYKAEVERTEALQAYFNQQIINIFNELAKDNSITKSNKISQIIPGIQEVKSVRKRFAFGIRPTPQIMEVDGGYCEYIPMNLSFTPSVIIAKPKKTLYHGNISIQYGSEGKETDSMSVSYINVGGKFKQRTLITVDSWKYGSTRDNAIYSQLYIADGVWSRLGDSGGGMSDSTRVCKDNNLTFDYESGKFVTAFMDSEGFNDLRKRELNYKFGETGNIEYWVAFE